jgi:hypothetical protein
LIPPPSWPLPVAPTAPPTVVTQVLNNHSQRFDVTYSVVVPTQQAEIFSFLEPADIYTTPQKAMHVNTKSDDDSDDDSIHTEGRKPRRCVSHTLKQQYRAVTDPKSKLRQQVSPSTWRRWLFRVRHRLYNKFKQSKINRRRFNGAGDTPLLGEYEYKIVNFIMEKRDKMEAVLDDDIKNEARRIAGLVIPYESFLASPGWFMGFKRRHGIRLRMVTSYSRKYTNAQLNEYQRQYADQLQQVMDDKGIQKAFVWNMDETPMYKDNPPKRTYTACGALDAAVRTTKSERTRMTVVLCCSWNGDKLPVLVIRKSESEKEPVLKKYTAKCGEVVYFCGQKKAWNDGRIMVKWINELFSKRPGDKSTPVILTMDNVSFHKKPECAAALLDQKAVVSTFPPNTTARTQPLDHCINGVVKKKLQAYWTTWMQRSNKEYTPAGNLKVPGFELLMEWIARAWHEVDPETIKASFDHCLKKTHVCTQHESARDQPGEADPNWFREEDDTESDPDFDPNEATFSDWLENLDEPEDIGEVC